MDILLVTLAGAATALATGLGAIPVFFLGERTEALRPLLLGLTIGVMGVASVVGLLIPAADEGTALQVAIGLALGVAFLGGARLALARADATRELPRERGSALALLVFVVLFVHSLPEGFAIGTAYASNTEGLGLFVILAIGLQNIPEGTSVAIPMDATGASRWRQFWAAVGTSVPQPIGAVVAYLLVDTIDSLLPVSFAFAAGAMLALIVVELMPQAFARDRWRSPLAGVAFGSAVMLVLSTLLGVDG